MQGDISSTTAFASWRSITRMSMFRGREHRYLANTEHSQIGVFPAVPGSPGRARQLPPYPPSCCKR
jgi:hypothetical protein